MKISVIGAGNTGSAAAAYFSSLNHPVKLYTRNSVKAETLRKTGISVSGKLNGKFYVDVVHDIDEAVKGAECICIFTKANHHKYVFRLLSGLLERGQRVIIFNGNWGAYEAEEILGEELKEKGIILAETTTMPFIARAEEIGKIEILGLKKQIGFSALDRKDSERLLSELKLFFPDVIVKSNVIATSLMSINPVIHVPISLFNIVRIEEGREFNFYTEGTSDLCVKFINSIDRERINIGKKLGMELPAVLDIINSYWPKKYSSLLEALRQNYPFSKAPQSINHRYIDEDLPYGIVPFVRLGGLLDVDTPYSSVLADLFRLYKTGSLHVEEIDFNLDRIYRIMGGPSE